MSPKKGRPSEGTGRRPAKKPRPAQKPRPGANDAPRSGSRGAPKPPGPRGGSGRRDNRRPSPMADVVKGRYAIAALLHHTPRRILTLFHFGGGKETAELVARAHDLKIEVRRGAPDERLADDHLAQGIAAQVGAFPYRDLPSVLHGPPDGRVLLVLDSITDQRNLGAILRSAAFFGVHAVILPRDRAAPVSPAVERISRGATAIVPIARVTNLARTISTLRDRGYLTVATVLSPDAIPLTSAKIRAPVALVLGGEGTGTRRLVAEKCDLRATLAARGPMQSLNVASFATLAMAACHGFSSAETA